MKYKNTDIVEAIAYIKTKCGGSDPSILIDSLTKDLIIETYNDFGELVKIIVSPVEASTFTKIQVTRRLGDEM